MNDAEGNGIDVSILWVRSGMAGWVLPNYLYQGQPTFKQHLNSFIFLSNQQLWYRLGPNLAFIF